MKVFNHSSVAKNFTLVPESREGFDVEPAKASVFVGPLSEGEQTFKVSVRKEISPGVFPLFLSVKFDGWDLNEWCESLVDVTH